MNLIVGEPFNPYRIFQFAAVPNFICSRVDLSPGSKLLYGKLCQYCQKDGKVYPSQLKLATELGVEERQVQRYAQELKDNNLLKMDYPTGQDRLLHRNACYFFLWVEDAEESLQSQPNVSVPDTSNRTGREPSDKSGPTIREKYVRETISPAPAGTGGSVIKKSVVGKPWIKLAQLLMDAILKTREGKFTTSQLHNWARHIEKINTSQGIDFKTIKKIMKWYCSIYPTQYQDRFCVKALSGASFCEKFDKLLDFYRRESRAAAERGGFDEERPAAKQAEIKFNATPEVVPDFDLSTAKGRMAKMEWKWDKEQETDEIPPEKRTKIFKSLKDFLQFEKEAAED